MTEPQAEPQISDEAARRRIADLVAERDAAREECGYLRRMYKFVSGERDGFIVYYRQVMAVRAVVERARKVSPSERAVVYVADVERALGMDAPTPHKVGGNDGSTTSGSVSPALPETGE